MAQYKAIALQNKKEFLTGEDIYIDFIMYDENSTQVTGLDEWSFKCELTDGNSDIKLMDEDQTGGDATQIAKTSNKFTIHAAADDTGNWFGGSVLIEIFAIDSDDNTYCVYHSYIDVIETEIDW